MFFICPEPVYRSLMRRLGTTLSHYPITSGALTFRHYKLEPAAPDGEIRKLIFIGQFTTTIQDFRDVYNSSLSLRDMRVVAATIQEHIQTILNPRRRGRKKSDPTQIVSSLFC